MTAFVEPAGSIDRDAPSGSAAEPSAADRAKRAAAGRAAAMVEDGMRVGLGTGSTAEHLVRRLGERVAEGLSIEAVSTSRATERLAREAGIRTVTLDDVPWLDLTIDGADEFDPNLNLIKGAGGALLREKIVATCSDRMVVIADESKQVETLGAFPLPVEVVPFGWRATKALLEEALSGLGAAGAEVRLRMRGGEAYETDNGNHVLDVYMKRIENPWQTSLVVNQIPGVVENGLFVDVCDAVVIGRPDGSSTLREPGPGEDRRLAAGASNAFSAV